MTLAPNVNDSESQQLNGLASTTGIKKCVDFVSDLPWEIVRTYIMPRILGGTSRSPVHRLERSCGYLDVCSNWAKRIIAAYDSNYFILDVGDTLSDDCCMRIRMLVPYIESLSLRDLGARHIPQFLKCQTLVSLTRLRIKVTCSQETLWQLLEIAPNLTYLDIKYVDNIETPFAVFEVLDRCPKLIRLDLLLHPDATLDTAISQLDRTYDNIIHFQAVCKNWHKVDMFIPLIQCMPNVRLLSLTYFPSSSIMNTIKQHCAKLQQLFLHYPFVQHESLDDIKEDEEDENDIPGLRLLTINGGFHNGNKIAETMIRHSATLESLVLEKEDMLQISPVGSWNCFGPVEFTQLKSLSIPPYFEDRMVHFIQWVVVHAPNLESLETIASGTALHHLMDLLRDRPSKRIGFFYSRNYQHHEKRFLEDHIQRGTESHLEALKCTFGGMNAIVITPASWINLIPMLKQLKKLELHMTSDIMIRGFSTFIQQVSDGCGALEKVMLTWMCFNYTNMDIRPLSRHWNLQEVIVDAVDIPSHFMRHLTSFRHLKVLHLKYNIIDWNALAILKNQVPGLVYTDKYGPTL